MKKLTGFVSIAVSLSVLISSAVQAHEGSHTVVVDDFAFTPRYLQIDPGERVTWDVREDGHTITSDNGLFDYAPASGDLIVSEPFADRGTYNYHCEIHRGMTGTIQVGERVLPPPDAPAEVRVVPSDAFPTLNAALEGTPDKTLIELRPGTYDVAAPLELATPGLTLKGVDAEGLPADPASVVLRGRQGAMTGISVTGSAAAPQWPIAVENLTVTGFLDTGIAVSGSTGFRLSSVRAVGNVEHGIRAIGSARGRIVDSFVFGHRRSGISIEVCETCDIRVENVEAENNFVGLIGDNAGSLVIRSSRFTDNASGLVLRSVGTRSPHIQQGAHVYGNEFLGNSNTDAPAPSVFSTTEALELPVGAGIWVQGGWHDVIENNTVTGSHYGVVVTGSTVPTYGGRVSGNKVAHNAVDLGWDGLGSGLCFTSNQNLTNEKTAIVSEPARIQDLYSCGSAATVGVPYPKVTADLAAYAVRNYYCKEIDGRSCI